MCRKTSSREKGKSVFQYMAFGGIVLRLAGGTGFKAVLRVEFELNFVAGAAAKTGPRGQAAGAVHIEAIGD